jgi:hypothetical protein
VKKGNLSLFIPLWFASHFYLWGEFPLEEDYVLHLRIYVLITFVAWQFRPSQFAFRFYFWGDFPLEEDCVLQKHLLLIDALLPGDFPIKCDCVYCLKDFDFPLKG